MVVRRGEGRPDVLPFPSTPRPLQWLLAKNAMTKGKLRESENSTLVAWEGLNVVARKNVLKGISTSSKDRALVLLAVELSWTTESEHSILIASEECHCHGKFLSFLLRQNFFSIWTVCKMALVAMQGRNPLLTKKIEL